MRSGFVRHPLSALFGDMDERALFDLAEDIKAQGILEPVVMFEGKVLDGWHRCMAGQIAQVDISTVEFDGENASTFVISKNMHRRQQPLTASQRAMIVVEANNMRRPGNQIGTSSELKSHDELAAQAQTSTRTISDAHAAKKAGLSEAVRGGELSLKQAAQQARSPHIGPAPPPPTPLEKANAEIEQLKVDIADRDEKFQGLTDHLQSYLDVAGTEDEQQTKFAQLYEQIRVLESQLNEHMDTASQFKRECHALRKRLGQS